MSVSTKVRIGAALMMLGAAAACSDVTSAPTATAPRIAAPTTGASQELVGSWVVITNDSVVANFVVDPRTPTILKFGGNQLVLPAGSICDPATSGYGETLWDTPCTPLTSNITITATISSPNGHTRLDIHPSIRFVPSADSTQWVKLTLRDASTLPGGFRALLNWERPITGEWVNESLSDATLRPTASKAANTVTRRLKHFSGYLLSTGAACEPSPSVPDCIAYAP